MRSKAPLALIEQIIMLLVFALAAALCLRAFVWADQQSEINAQRDRAMLLAQSAAETVKYCRGDLEEAARTGGAWDGSGWSVGYDGHWQETQSDVVYRLRAEPVESGLDYLGTAVVEVLRDEQVLVSLNVCWQEVGGNE